MQVLRAGDLFIITRIAGPVHNYLGLALARSAAKASPLRIEAVDAEGVLVDIRAGDPRVKRVVQEVGEGVRIANIQMNSHVRVAKIRICLDDSPALGVYRDLALALIQQVVMSTRIKSASMSTRLQAKPSASKAKVVSPLSFLAKNTQDRDSHSSKAASNDIFGRSPLTSVSGKTQKIPQCKLRERFKRAALERLSLQDRLWLGRELNEEARTAKGVAKKTKR